MSSDGILTFLRARFDEHERVAQAAKRRPAGGDWRVVRDPEDMVTVVGGAHLVADPDEPEYTEHIALHDPDSVLAEVDAKRRILDEHKTYDVHSGFGCGICAFNGWDKVIEPEGWCTTVRLLALPYADHPDYRAEWRLTP